MTAYRRPTLKTALWLMLTSSILFAGNALAGGVEWKRPAHNFGSSIPHSFPIAVTTELLFWVVLPTVAGMFCRSGKTAVRPCSVVALLVFGLYAVCARYDYPIFGYSAAGFRVETIVLSALFGPLLAVELPANMAQSQFNGPLIFTMIYGIWLGYFVIAADQIVGSMQPKPAAPTPTNEAGT